MRLVLGVVLVLFLGLAASEHVTCYFSSWAVWRPGDGKFDVDDIDPFLCTQLIFGFTGLSNHTWTIEVLDPWNELCPDEEGGHNCAFDRFTALKKINPNLDILLAIGGWNEGSEDYSVMAADPQKRRTFIASTVELVQKHHFDGLDFDWEYPGNRGGVPEDKENFILLLKELREAFQKVNPPLMLTAAVAAGKPTIESAYHIPQLVPLLDQVHLMTYDMHGAWENFTGHNAPLCPHYWYEDFTKDFYVMFGVDYWLQHGVPPEKLIMGIPTYGRCFTLDDINDHGMFAPAQKPGPAGPYIRIPGTLGFNEICERVQSQECTIVNDPCLHEPYFYCQSDKIWCGFDDEQSVYEKARYAKNMKLGGVLVWTIDTDDFHPRCYPESFHLIKKMKEGVNAPADGKFPECKCEYGPITEPPTTPAYVTTHEPPTSHGPVTPTYEPPTSHGPATPTHEPPTSHGPVTPTYEPPTSHGPVTPTYEPPTSHGPVTPTYEPPTSQEPVTPTTKPTTQKPTTQKPTKPTEEPTTTPHGGHPRPDCSEHVDGSTFPHDDCNKYWVCANGQAILELCGPGTLFDEDLNVCNWEDAVDTSACRMWVCEVDNTCLPHVDCDKFYWCYQGSPHEKTCAPGTFYHKACSCASPVQVDTSKCNIPH